MTGLIFDIKEFALNDGKGIRTTVFFKGCPLRCAWCHNPEGLEARPELYVRQNGCLSCGLCRRPCSHPECQPFGRCLHICPKNLLSVKGKVLESEALADQLLARRDFLSDTEGGITLSGGEPLMQADFAAELLDLLRGKLHRAIETSGYASGEAFEKVIRRCDFVYMDLKLADPAEHQKWTGVDNRRILENARLLRASRIPHCFRVPLIPGVTDGEKNLRAIREIAGDSPIETLPYNPLAPAKYASVGKQAMIFPVRDNAESPH